MKKTASTLSCSLEEVLVETDTFEPSQYAEIFALQNQILELVALGVDDKQVLQRSCELEV